MARARRMFHKSLILKGCTLRDGVDGTHSKAAQIPKASLNFMCGFILDINH